MPTKEELKDYYCIPKWCRFHPYAHFDGMGGCWGISGGDVLKKGERYCKECDYHQDNVQKLSEGETLVGRTIDYDSESGNETPRIDGAKKNAEWFLRKAEE